MYVKSVDRMSTHEVASKDMIARTKKAPKRKGKTTYVAKQGLFRSIEPRIPKFNHPMMHHLPLGYSPFTIFSILLYHSIVFLVLCCSNFCIFKMYTELTNVAFKHHHCNLIIIMFNYDYLDLKTRHPTVSRMHKIISTISQSSLVIAASKLNHHVIHE